MINTAIQSSSSLPDILLGFGIDSSKEPVTIVRISGNRFIITQARHNLLYFVVAKHFPDGTIEAYGDYCAPTRIGELYFKAFIKGFLKELGE